MRKYLHDYDKQQRRQLTLLDEDKISEKNRELIKSYYNYKYSSGVGLRSLGYFSAFSF